MPPPATPLRRILGLGFGLAVIFGGTVGVGILRLPATIAAQLPNPWLIAAVWLIGGAYALLGAIQVAELGAALPQAGGFYVYTRHAWGPAAGFAMGWADWLNNCAVVAYGAAAAADYLTALIPGLSPGLLPAGPHTQTALAIATLALFAAIHWFGLQLSSRLQQVTSSVTAVTFLALAVACLFHSSSAVAAPHPTGSLFVAIAPLMAALRAIVVTYDGWYEAIYFTEEDTNAAHHLPRAMIGGVLTIIGLYLLMNLAFVHVLSLPALAASTLPAADAARIVFPAGSAQFVTALSLLTLLSLINAVLLGAPRILFAIGRDGLFSSRAAQVSAGGTPRLALAISAALVAIFLLSGQFDQIIAVAAILVAAMYCVNYSAVLWLRIRQPNLPRPFRAWGYPFTTLLVLLCSIIFLIFDLRDDPASGLRAAALLLVALPTYRLLSRRSAAKLPERP